MADYTFSLIPLDKVTFLSGNPMGGTFISATGESWNLEDSFTFSRADLVTVTYSDTNDTLDDDQWWESGDGNGRGTQTIQTGGLTGVTGQGTPTTAVAGEDITDEFEIHLTGDDGKDYTLVVVATIPANSSNAPDFKYIGFTFDGEWPPEGTVLTVTADANGKYHYDNESAFASELGAPCFTRGTMIATPRGAVAIETLAGGDLVLTRDNGPQPIRWIGSRRLGRAMLNAAPNLRPIRIRAGALGAGVPAADLVVSPQHRVLVRSHIAQRMFGTAEVLVAAKQLLQLDGIDIADDLTEVQYFHILFDRHEVVLSNGAETESLYTGPMALKSVGRQARDEIFAIFPELRETTSEPPSARPLASGRQARKLAIRHVQNGKDLVSKMRNPCMS